MIATELAKRQQTALTKVTGEDPFVFSPGLIRELHLDKVASLIVWLSARTRPTLPKSIGGRPIVYRDESILVVIFVMSVWQLSPEAMVRLLKRWSVLALACGFEEDRIVSSSQLRRRRDALGIWVYFITFCLLVYILVRRGLITGRDWVIDSTIIDAYNSTDVDAKWSFTNRFGYKVHMLICRDSLLPIMFLVSPANANDAPWAIPLMSLAQRIFRFSVDVVRADAAYFTKDILAFIQALGAVHKVVYNPRRRGKRDLVTLQWTAHFFRDKGKRGYIERFFALLKRYFRLQCSQRTGYWNAYRHAFEVCFGLLLVAWLAHHLGRTDLMHARSRILAPC